MIPQDIYQKYKGFKNPYRELIVDKNDVVAYEYSDQIPSWFLEYVIPLKNYPAELIKHAIANSESRNYYSFYSFIFLKDFQFHIDQMKIIDPRYEIILEEKIPANEKSINTLYWDWLCKTTSYSEETCIVLHVLPSRYRNHDI